MISSQKASVYTHTHIHVIVGIRYTVTSPIIIGHEFGYLEGKTNTIVL